ncbi:MAG: CsbD family protein [Sciscionella sp.]
MGFMDKIKHQAEEMMGKGKEAAGKAAGDDTLKTEGQGDQASGQAKQGVDDIKEKAAGAFQETKDKLSDN